MGAAVISVGAIALCPHGGRVQMAGHSRVRIAGVPVVILDDASMIAGCPAMQAGLPAPCVRVAWLGGVSRVRIAGLPVVGQSGADIALRGDGTPGGAVQIIDTQTRVTAR